MKRSANAQWQGDLKSGQGQISVDSGLFQDAAYAFHTRFENEPGTNPEELIAAAHAGCFSMALSNELTKTGMNPKSVSTRAEVTLEKTDSGFGITRIHLEVTASVPGAGEDAFMAAANAAKAGCPVSKLLNAEISMSANLTS